MNTPSSSPSARSLPLPAFTHEIGKLRNTQADPKLHELQPFVQSTLESLSALELCVEQLPDLSSGCWFLESHYLSARDQVSRQIEVVRTHLLGLSTMVPAAEDPFAILPFTAELLKFAKLAMKSPAALRQPYVMESPLRVPDPPSEPGSDLPCDAPSDSDFLPL